MSFDMKIDEGVVIDEFLKTILIDSETLGEKGLDLLADATYDEVVTQLKHVERRGKRYGLRSPMHRDVKKTKTKTGRRIQGGKYTGTLWHIVNDGTYRTRATHFLDATLKNIDNQVDSILDKAGD